MEDSMIDRLLPIIQNMVHLKVMELIDNDLNIDLKRAQREITQLQISNADLNKRVETELAKVAENVAESGNNTELSKLVKSNTEKIANSNARLEHLELAERDDVVIVEGVTPKENESLRSAVMSALNGNSDINLKPHDVISCTMMGKQDDINPKPRGIRVKMSSRMTKKNVMRIKGQFRRKKTKIYIKEHLTPVNSEIFYKARTAKKYKIFHQVWTDAGRVWATINPDDKPIPLRNAEIIESEIDKAIGDGVEPLLANNEEYPPRPEEEMEHEEHDTGHRQDQSKGNRPHQGIGSRLRNLAESQHRQQGFVEQNTHKAHNPPWQQQREWRGTYGSFEKPYQQHRDYENKGQAKNRYQRDHHPYPGVSQGYPPTHHQSYMPSHYVPQSSEQQRHIQKTAAFLGPHQPFPQTQHLRHEVPRQNNWFQSSATQSHSAHHYPQQVDDRSYANTVANEWSTPRNPLYPGHYPIDRGVPTYNRFDCLSSY